MISRHFKCQFCKFFMLNLDYGRAPENGFFGDCRRSSPKVDTAPANYGGALWPVVSHSDFCGEGRPLPLKKEDQEVAS